MLSALVGEAAHEAKREMNAICDKAGRYYNNKKGFNHE
jgi:hypothetical protein